MKTAENEKRKMENEGRITNPELLQIFHKPLSSKIFCSACGAIARRGNARFCATCGKYIREDYQPLDSLRASYRLQGRVLETRPPQQGEIKNLFEKNENTASATAWAFVVYSLVPYLGILFCPGAILMGGIGVFVAHRRPYLGGGRTSVYSIALSFVILSVQLLLWYLLYLIPELNR